MVVWITKANTNIGDKLLSQLDCCYSVLKIYDLNKFQGVTGDKCVCGMCVNVHLLTLKFW